MRPVPRSRAQRKADTLALLRTEHTGFDARTEPGDYVYLRVTPTDKRYLARSLYRLLENGAPATG